MKSFPGSLFAAELVLDAFKFIDLLRNYFPGSNGQEAWSHISKNINKLATLKLNKPGNP